MVSTALAQNKQLPEQATTQWYPYLEWEVMNPSVEGNPFDVAAHAVFRSVEGNQSTETSLFYDGNDTWKFRFTGAEVGSWTVETFSNDEDLNGWTGHVTVRPNPDADAHGFIRSFGSKWGWQGTETAFIPQFLMGKRCSIFTIQLPTK